MRFEYLKKLGEPGRMSRPGRSGNQFSIHHSFGEIHRNEGSAGKFHLRRARRIRIQFATLEDSRRRQYLRPVTERSNWLIRFVEVPHNLKHLGIEPQILWPATPWNYQAIVVFCFDLVESRIQNKVMSALL